MARRTKAWWAALTPLDRLQLYHLDRCQRPRRAQWCAYCVNTNREKGSGLCWRCIELRQAIIDKADRAAGGNDGSPD